MHAEKETSVNDKNPEKKKKNKKVKKTQAELLIHDALGLLIKIVAIIAFTIFVFTFMFGVYRNNDPSMIPAIQDGDLVFYYRLDKRYVSADVLVAEYGEKKLSLRSVRPEAPCCADPAPPSLRSHPAQHRAERFLRFLPAKQPLRSVRDPLRHIPCGSPEQIRSPSVRIEP